MNRAIGVFDSGLGGLTAVKELSALLPNENIVYLGDTARVPYGSRSPEMIKKFALQDLNFILKQDIKAVLVACGTISSVALEILSEKCPVFLTGVVTPTTAAAVKSTKNGKIAVIATSATIKSGAYKREIESYDKKIEIIEKACPLFVPLVENGYFDKENRAAKIIVSDYLNEIREKKADTVILGCTHYPVLRPLIEDFFGSDVNLIDSGKEAAVLTAKKLSEAKILNTSNQKGKQQFFVTDEQACFTTLAELFLEKQISDEVKRVELQDL